MGEWKNGEPQGCFAGCKQSAASAGARTFLSAASPEGRRGPVASQAIRSSNVAADKNVRAPAVAASPRCESQRLYVSSSPPSLP
jgi:hypothetical protein